MVRPNVINATILCSKVQNRFYFSIRYCFHLRRAGNMTSSSWRECSAKVTKKARSSWTRRSTPPRRSNTQRWTQSAYVMHSLIGRAIMVQDGRDYSRINDLNTTIWEVIHYNAGALPCIGKSCPKHGNQSICNETKPETSVSNTPGKMVTSFNCNCTRFFHDNSVCHI